MIHSTHIKTTVVCWLLTLLYQAFSQKTDSLRIVSDTAGAINVINKGSLLSTRTDNQFIAGYSAGSVSVTGNGISLIPAFSLGKPAVIFDMPMGGKRLSFEPQLRLSLAGKPCRAAGAVVPVLVAV